MVRNELTAARCGLRGVLAGCWRYTADRGKGGVLPDDDDDSNRSPTTCGDLSEGCWSNTRQRDDL
jgi:hypothetical protein